MRSNVCGSIGTASATLHGCDWVSIQPHAQRSPPPFIYLAPYPRAPYAARLYHVSDSKGANTRGCVLEISTLMRSRRV